MMTATIMYILHFYVSHSQWIAPSLTLTDKIQKSACGYHDNIIYVVGGDDGDDLSDAYGYIEYNISNNTFSRTTSFFPRSLTSTSNWWFQINNVLYMTTWGTIHTFNLASKQFTEALFTAPNYNSYTRVIYACLAGDVQQSLLYYMGGMDLLNTQIPVNTLQILDINDGSWITGPNMNQVRVHFACIVSPNKQLYAIGGSYSGTSSLTGIKTIEYIGTTNIQNNQWILMNEDLSEYLVFTRAVLLDHNIFILGGRYPVGTNWDDTEVTDKVHVINTLTNEVYVASDRLAYKTFATAPIIVDRVIYAFGGWDHPDGWYMDSGLWQYNTEWVFKLSASPSPTRYPTTTHPTAHPTVDPTADPIATLPDPFCDNGIRDGPACCLLSCGSCGGPGCYQKPGGSQGCCYSTIISAGNSCDNGTAPCVITSSRDPTEPPTTYTTFHPSSDPTIASTVDPTSVPTTDPTSNPTNDPTTDPISFPTQDPTHYPIHEPTSDQTEEPTTNPSTYVQTPGPSKIPSASPNDAYFGSANVEDITSTLSPTRSGYLLILILFLNVFRDQT